MPQDGSSLAFRCLEFLIEVVPTDASRADAEARLKNSAAWIGSRGAKSVEVVVAIATDAAAAISAAVREVLPDVIAMSTRGSRLGVSYSEVWRRVSFAAASFRSCC